VRLRPKRQLRKGAGLRWTGAADLNIHRMPL
jgi:hypothetical protein